jgi:hypothetical protein
MIRSIHINGNENKQLTVKVDDMERQFSLDQDISAKELFDILQFKKGDTYNVAKGESGAIPQTAFDAFCGLLSDIAQQISAITNSSAEVMEEDGNDLIATDTDDSGAPISS